MKHYIKNAIFTCLVMMGIVSGTVENVWAKSIDGEHPERYDYVFEGENSEVSINEIEKEIENEIDMQGQEVLEKTLDLNEFDILVYDTDAAYTEYVLTDLLLTKYNEEGEFTAVITENERYKVPYTTVDDEKGVIIYSKQNNGELELQAQILVGETEHICVSMDEVSNTINQQLNEEIKNVIITYSNTYYMTIVYVETDNGHYIVPYSEKGLTGLENGKIYSEKDFFVNMNNMFDESQLEENPDGNGGLPYRQREENSIVRITIAFLLAGISIYGAKKLKKQERCLNYNNGLL